MQISKIKLYFIAGVLLLSVTNLHAQDKADAQKEEAEKYYTKAEKERKYIKSTNHGRKIFDYYMKAANLGHPVAQYRAAQWLEKGEYCQKNTQEAFRLYSESSFYLSTVCQAICLMEGIGTAKDTEKGLDILVKHCDWCRNVYAKYGKNKTLQNIMYLLSNSNLFYREGGGGTSHRTTLAKNNVKAIYVADVMSFVISDYLMEDFKPTRDDYFMRSLWKGCENAIPWLELLASQGNKRAKAVFEIDQEEGQHVQKLRLALRDIVKSGKPTVVEDDARTFLDRFQYQHRAHPLATVATAMLPFYTVNDALAVDISNKQYAGGLLANDYADIDRKMMTDAIEVCKSNNVADLQSYYDQCRPLLEAKLEAITAKEKQQNAQLRGALTQAFSELKNRWTPPSSSASSSSSSSSKPNVNAEVSVNYQVLSDWKEDFILSQPRTFYTHMKKVKFDDGTEGKIYINISKDKYCTDNGDRYETEADAAAAEYFYKKHNVKREKGKITGIELW